MNIEMTPKLFQTTYPYHKFITCHYAPWMEGMGTPLGQPCVNLTLPFFVRTRQLSTVDYSYVKIPQSCSLEQSDLHELKIRKRKLECMVYRLPLVSDTLNHALIESQVSLTEHFTLQSHDLISNSPYCLPYNSYDVGLENLKLDLLIIP